MKPFKLCLQVLLGGLGGHPVDEELAALLEDDGEYEGKGWTMPIRQVDDIDCWDQRSPDLTWLRKLFFGKLCVDF